MHVILRIKDLDVSLETLSLVEAITEIIRSSPKNHQLAFLSLIIRRLLEETPDGLIAQVLTGLVKKAAAKEEKGSTMDSQDLNST
jgi:hypothetical protein